MKEVFGDTCYFVGLLDEGDSLNDATIAAAEEIASSGVQLITSHDILVELLNYFSGYGPYLRAAAVQFVDTVENRRDVFVVSQSPVLFNRGKRLYAQRSDKGYSLTDCISMEIARARAIKEILTSDDHFSQEGFRTLLIV